VIRFRCTACKQLLGVADSLAENRVTCPKCKGQVLAPAASTESTPQPDSGGGRPRTAPAKRRPTEEEEILEVLPVEEEDDIEEIEEVEEVERPRQRSRPQPRRRKRRPDRAYQDNSPFLTMGRVWGGLMLLIGLFALCGGLASGSKGGAYGAGQMAGSGTGGFLIIAGIFQLIRG
jgi:phage FluMu protein Com